MTDKELAKTLKELEADGLIEKRGDRWYITSKGLSAQETEPEAGNDFGTA
jgi:DNA-binding HxlR family transcriptional regulator